MKKEIALEWVKDLRSGEFVQGNGELEKVVYDDEDKPFTEYCCLGVLGVQYNRTAPVPLPLKGEEFLLPELKEWSGMADDAGTPTNDTACAVLQKLFADQSLAGANDNGATFEQIADFIEKNWETL
jgi:hypothetical protein